MLKGVPPLRGQVEARPRLLEDVERRMDGAVTDGVDAHRVPPLGRRQHERAHALRAHREVPPVAGVARVRVRLGKVGGVLARHAVEELLEARRLDERARVGRAVALLQPFEARHVIEQRREQVRAQGERTARIERLVDVLADEVAAGQRHERHVADRGYALLGHARHLLGVGAFKIGLAEPLEQARLKFHGRRLADDARELARRIAVVDAARRGLGVACDAELLERATVQPERVAVARTHGAGAIRERLVERALRGRHRRVPTVVTPALRDHPRALGQRRGELPRARNELGLALTHVHEHEGRVVDRRVEEVQVSVVEAGADETVAEIHDRGGRRACGDDVVRRAHVRDAPGLIHRERELARGGAGARRGEHPLRTYDELHTIRLPRRPKPDCFARQRIRTRPPCAAPRCVECARLTPSGRAAARARPGRAGTAARALVPRAGGAPRRYPGAAARIRQGAAAPTHGSGGSPHT